MDKSKITRRKAIASLAALSAVPASAGVAALSRDNTSEQQPPESRFPLEGRPMYEITGGTSRQFTTFDLDTKEKAIEVKPGEKKILVDHNQPGIITRFWMTVSGWFWRHWEPNQSSDQTILKKLIFRIYWDGNPYPSVEAPIGDFFGVGLCEYKHYMSKYLGMSSGGLYSYFPMPFNQVRIEVENLHEKQNSFVFLNANYEPLPSLPVNTGRFHCAYSAGTKEGQEPLPVFETKGKGHFVGCCLSMQCEQPNYLGYLEAPEYIYIDNDGAEPTIVGTGLEDYFNGGWYFRDGEFHGPLHGVPVKDALRSMIAMYRFHEEDAIHFNQSIKMAFINHRPSLPFKYSSTAYWYQEEAVTVPYPLPEKDKLVDWYRIRDRDHQAIP